MPLDYSNIIGIALLVISELMPLIDRIPANGIIDSFALMAAYAYVKCCGSSALAQEVNEMKEIAPSTSRVVLDVSPV